MKRILILESIDCDTALETIRVTSLNLRAKGLSLHDDDDDAIRNRFNIINY